MRKTDIKPLSDADQRHLLAAQGWLELGIKRAMEIDAHRETEGD